MKKLKIISPIFFVIVINLSNGFAFENVIPQPDNIKKDNKQYDRQPEINPDDVISKNKDKKLSKSSTKKKSTTTYEYDEFGRIRSVTNKVEDNTPLPH